MAGDKRQRPGDNRRTSPQTQSEQQEAFCNDLTALVGRYRQEFDLTYASIIGCIEVVKTDLMLEILMEDEEGEE